MKEKRFYKKLIGSCVLMLCMAVVMIFTVFQADASNESKIIKYEPDYIYSSNDYIHSETKEKIAPKLEGYLFAGWYTLDGTTYSSVKNPQEGEKYYAKFVPEEVLDIQAQVSGTLFDDDTTNDGTAAIRFVTSLDESTSYQKVGFKIKKGSTGKEEPADTTPYVYRTLYAVGATDGNGKAEEYKPEDLFHSTSYYFKTWTITNITEKAYNTDVTVTPYWITLDGTRVEGTKAIKTVNLGRSWVYIDTEANSTDKEEYGTRKHPFTKLDSALDAVTWVDGKITVKGTTEFEVSSTFKWNPDKTKVNGKVRTITVTGENGTNSFISFSTVPNMGINDNVTFENVKVDFASQVYANGNRFIIAEGVAAESVKTNLHGGAEKTEVENTHLEIYAGSWKTIYGGGGYYNDSTQKQVSQGPVKGNTNIILGDANVFDNSKTDQNMVFGGGDGSSVGGNTNIVVGGNFNKDVTVTAHKTYSTVYGGGRRSGGDVAGDTNVTIQDSAKVNFVYGGGAKGTKVLGTCHVTMNGGNVLSIWGGGATMENTEPMQNADTSVVVNAGTVQQIFGGNGTGMTGNTYVQVLGGTVTRRIYGGCYHDEATADAYVKGFTIVEIGKNANLTLNQDIDNSICAGSRYAGKQDEEIGILIFNENTYSSLSGKVNSPVNTHPYDYLVKSTTGGTVTTSTKVIENGVLLSVNPTSETIPGTITNGTNVTYFKGAGVCELPTRVSLATQCTVEVDFSPSDAQAGLESCEARIDGMYYPKLQDAVGIAKVRKDKPTVTLMNDATVDTELDIVAGAEFTILSEGNPKTITSTLTGDGDTLFRTHGKLTLENLNITGGHHTFRNFAGSVVKAENVDITDIEGAAIYQSNGTFTGIALNIDTVVKHGIFIEGGTVNLDNVTISNIVGDASSRDGIHCAGGTLNITANNEQKNGVTISNVHSRGIFLQGKIKADQVKIKDANLYGIYVDGSAQPEISNLTIEGVIGADNVTDAEGTGIVLEDNSQAKLTTVTVKNTKNKGIYIRDNAQATISNATVQDAIKQGVFLENDAQATITGLTVSNTSNQGVFLQYNAQATISDFTIRGKGDTALRCKDASKVTATNGTIYGGTAASGSLYGIYIDGKTDGTGASNVRLTNVKIERASSNDHALVVIKEGATLTMNEQDGGTSSIDGKKGTYTGRGVEVEGTFNLNGGTICNNDLTSGDGAGVLVSAGGTLNVTGGNLSNNTAANAGGAVAVKGSSNFTLDGTGSIANNIAINDGAGVYLYDGATFTMNGGTITGNNFGDQSGSGRGGAVSIAANGKTTKFELNGGTISDNVGRAGGAVIIRNANCEFKMTGGEIKNNSVTTFDLDATSPTKKGQGGAVWMGNGSFVMEGGKISSNKAETKYGSGGAVYVNGGTCTMQGGEITGNTAAFNSGNNGGGGGILVAGGTCTIKGTASVSSNKATTQEGGGVCVTGGTFSLQGGTISSNEAKAGGGGLSVNGSGATVTISGGAISNNIAQYGAGMMVRACKAISMTSGTINGNEASKQGGGIYLKPVTFTMTGGSITDNKTNDGGAIFVSKGSGTSSAATINYGGGIISGNYSSNAIKAGIYCDTTTTANQGIINYTTSDATIADVITNMTVKPYASN